MQRSGSQKFLLVISIINIVLAVFVLISGIMTMLGGSLMGTLSPTQAAELAAETGMTTGEVGALAGMGGFAMLFSGAIELIMGILGLRAANDNQKIMPVWVLALISLVMGVVGIIVGVVQGHFSASDIGSYLGTLVGSGLMFWVANNIKRQAGK